MHHPRHQRIIWNYRAAALLFFFKRLLLAAGLLLMLMAVSKQHHSMVQAGLWMVGAAVLTGIIQRIFAAGAKCPLCMMPPLGKRGCAKHRQAGTLLGSIRTPIAFSVLFLGKLRCPYCNEPIELRLKSPKRHI